MRLTVLLTSILFATTACSGHTPSLQQKSSHMITFLNEEGEDASTCSATAIGPHAILTAEHCNNGLIQHSALTLDLSTHHTNILGSAKDDRDHVIYLLDGPAFENFLRPDELLNVAPAEGSESVRIYGDGLGRYPPRLVKGHVDAKANAAELSDVDHAQGTLWLKLAVLPGDSGSAVYNSAGQVVGLVTYGFGAPARRAPSKGVVAFALNFSQDVILAAHGFGAK